MVQSEVPSSQVVEGNSQIFVGFGGSSPSRIIRQPSLSLHSWQCGDDPASDSINIYKSCHDPLPSQT